MVDNMSYTPVPQTGNYRQPKRSPSQVLTLAAALALCLVEACAFVAKTVATGGERPVAHSVVTTAKVPPAEGSRVIADQVRHREVRQLLTPVAKLGRHHVAR